MLQSLQIQNFKRFEDLRFPKLKRVNLITGKNNTGKTGVLEALLLLLDPDHFLGLLPTAFRNSSNVGDPNENVLKWLFTNRNTARPIMVSCDTNLYDNFAVSLHTGDTMPSGFRQLAVSNYTISANIPSDKHKRSVNLRKLDLGAVCLPARPSEPAKDAIDFDRVVLKSGGEERIEALLKVLEPRLKSVRSIKPFGASLIYIDVGLKEKIPAFNLGQGFLRMLSIYAEVIASGKRVLLIDEIENGLHYSVLTEIWRGILNITEKEDVQVFATTHSYECIRAAHLAFSETMDYDFALHRLEETDGKINVTTFDQESMEASLENNFEIR